jgi:hypothetical protein
MSTLANTNWTITGAEVGSFSAAFNADGTVLTTHPNGQSATGNWAEAGDGHFMFQWPNSTTNPNINEVFFGMHEGGEGTGHDCDITTALRSFTMSKN